MEAKESQMVASEGSHPVRKLQKHIDSRSDHGTYTYVAWYGEMDGYGGFGRVWGYILTVSDEWGNEKDFYLGVDYPCACMNFADTWRRAAEVVFLPF